MDVGAKLLEWRPRTGRRSFGGSLTDEQLTSLESQGAAGPKRHETLVFGTFYKRPMSSCGRQSVDMMMMMSVHCWAKCLSNGMVRR
ncbi:jg2785 [Pararge aegeria aegeria]|uniref:Jg2785 protein n=1 Tax=Pararge aegeria aegeria TaxID=348720 RepID=A0A8S4QBN6_9NEOP|nr:jg2785 [Pararge aegeria aegeria]